MLTEFIKRSKGRDNKSLAKYAAELRQLLEKWEA
jgi:metallo-beta-lactamase family protein